MNVLNFLNHHYFLVIFLVLACIVFCIFFLPKKQFDGLWEHIIKKWFKKSKNEYIKEKKIDEQLFESFIADFHMEIKQTFTFSLLMTLATFIFSKELTPENILIAFSTVYVYTFVFSWKIIWTNINWRGAKTLLVGSVIFLAINLGLLYCAWKNNGEYWWILTFVLVFPTLYLQMAKCRFRYPNLY